MTSAEVSEAFEIRWDGTMPLLPPRNGGSTAEAMMAEAPAHGRYDHDGFERAKGKTSTRDQLLRARRQRDREQIATMHGHGVEACVIARVLSMRTCTVTRIVNGL